MESVDVCPQFCNKARWSLFPNDTKLSVLWSESIVDVLPKCISDVVLFMTLWDPWFVVFVVFVTIVDPPVEDAADTTASPSCSDDVLLEPPIRNFSLKGAMLFYIDFFFKFSFELQKVVLSANYYVRIFREKDSLVWEF